jgi:hypothetical protein
MTMEQNIDEHRYHAIRVELKQYQRCPLTEHQSPAYRPGRLDAGLVMSLGAEDLQALAIS